MQVPVGPIIQWWTLTSGTKSVVQIYMPLYGLFGDWQYIRTNLECWHSRERLSCWVTAALSNMHWEKTVPLAVCVPQNAVLVQICSAICAQRQWYLYVCPGLLVHVTCTVPSTCDSCKLRALWSTSKCDGRLVIMGQLIACSWWCQLCIDEACERCLPGYFNLEGVSPSLFYEDLGYVFLCLPIYRCESLWSSRWV